MTKVNAIISDGSEESAPSDWFTEDSIAAEVSDRSYYRGSCYYHDGAVQNLRATSLEVTATVTGSKPYRVTFRRLNHDYIEHHCTCSVGQNNVFCKHCVAVALALIARGGAKTQDEAALLRGYLEGLSKEELVTLLLEHSEEHQALRRLLEARAAASANKIDAKALRNTINRAFAVHDFVDYRAMPDYCRRVYPVVEALAALPESGRAVDALPLLDYALERGFIAWEQVDDSGGEVGEFIEMLARAHCRAATLAQPDGPDLANQLNRLKTTSPVDCFPLANYIDALGEEGLARYRWLLQCEWRKVPQREPGYKRHYSSSEPSYFGITDRMRELARLDGDVEALIAIESRDLSSPGCFLAVARILNEASRHDEALAWVERGDRSFPDEVDRHIAEYLIEAYANAARHDDALHVAWRDFAFRPDLKKYQKLKTCAERTMAWPQWREKALAELAADPKPDDGTLRSRFDARRRDTETLLDVHLWEGSIGAALAEARAYGCSLDRMATLAQACEKDHLDDAVRFYKKLAANCIEGRKKHSYAAAASYIRKIGHLLAAAKRRREFETYLAEVKREHGAKRNFMAELGVSCGIS